MNEDPEGPDEFLVFMNVLFAIAFLFLLAIQL